MISHVKFVSIPVKDQPRALEFYTEKLGFVVMTDVPLGEGNLRWLKLKTPHGKTQVVLFTSQGQEDRIGSFSNIVFATTDVQKTFEELKARGVSFTQEPTQESWGTYAMFKDPDGNQFVLSTEDKDYD